MSLTVHILADNNALPGFAAQWGFSCLLKTDVDSWLLDTGRNNIFMQNAKLMNLAPHKAKGVFLSHTHHDHTRGLPALLKAGFFRPDRRPPKGSSVKQRLPALLPRVLASWKRTCPKECSCPSPPTRSFQETSHSLRKSTGYLETINPLPDSAWTRPEPSPTQCLTTPLCSTSHHRDRYCFSAVATAASPTVWPACANASV